MLNFLLKVLAKDSSLIEDAADVRENVRSCLRKAALVNYTMLSEYAKIEGMLCRSKLIHDLGHRNIPTVC